MGILHSHQLALPRPQASVTLTEGRPPGRDLVPTLHHQAIDSPGAVLGLRQQLAGADHLDDLLVGVAEVGLQAEGEHLPQHDAERPHVAVRGELAIHDGLGWHPAHG